MRLGEGRVWEGWKGRREQSRGGCENSTTTEKSQVLHGGLGMAARGGDDTQESSRA